MRYEILAESIRLQKYELEFILLLYQAAKASCTPTFTRYAPWCHSDYSLAESETFIVSCEADWQRGSAFNFALMDRHTGEFCGGIGLNQPNPTHGFYNLGYWVRPSRHRQGLACQAVNELARAAFADLSGLNRIEILTVPDNLASQKTALAAGATYEGLLRKRLRLEGELSDALLFSLIRADFVELG